MMAVKAVKARIGVTMLMPSAAPHAHTLAPRAALLFDDDRPP